MAGKKETIVRKRRWQPSRRCKRLRFSGGADHPLSFLDLPDAAIHSIIEFIAPEKPNEQWLWLNGMRATCGVFRTISKTLAPTEFDLEQTFVPPGEDPEDYPDRITLEQRVPLLRSLVDAPWKGANLVKFIVNPKACRGRDGFTISRPIRAALRSILRAPGLFPKLETLCIDLGWDVSLVDAGVLAGLGQNFPQLLWLMLHGCFYRERVTPVAFGAFAESLQQPLHSLSLDLVPWMTDDHVEEFLRRHRDSNNIRRLHLNDCSDLSIPRVDLSDLTAGAIARHCNQLEQISLIAAEMTSSGLSSILRANNGNLKTIDISDCIRLGPDIIDFIIEHAPRLESLGVNYCHWFADDFLMQLIEGQQRSGLISLRNLDILFTGVTPAGLRRALEQAPDTLGLHGCIHIGCTRKELLDDDLSLHQLNLYIRSAREEWRAIARDFPGILFAEFSLSRRLTMLEEGPND